MNSDDMNNNMSQMGANTPVVDTPVVPETSVVPSAPVTPEVASNNSVVQDAPQNNIMGVQPVNPVTVAPGTPVNPGTPMMDVNNNAPKNNKMLFIIIGVVAVVAIIIGIFFIFNGGSSSKDVEKQIINDTFDPEKPILIKDEGKYGYISSEGKIIIQTKYNYASEFHGDHAVVKIDNNTDKTEYISDELYQVIDKSGKVLFTSDGYLEPYYYAEYDIWVINSVLYNGNFKALTGENVNVDYVSDGYLSYSDYANLEAGIIDYTGKKIFSAPASIFSVEICDNDNDTDDLYANVTSYVDPEQDLIVSLKSGDVLFTSSDPKNYYIFDEEDGLFIYYNHSVDDGYANRKYMFFANNQLLYETNEKVYEVEVYNYENLILEIDYGYDYEELGKDQRRYYYDAKNKTMLREAPSYENDEDAELDLIELTYGFKEFSSSYKYGLMSGDKIIVPAEYDEITYLDSNLFAYMKDNKKELVFLEKDDKTLLYDISKSEVVATFDTDYVTDYSDSTFIRANTYAEDGYTSTGYVIYNVLSGQFMSIGIDDDYDIGSNYLTITKDGQKVYYNTNLKQIYVASE